MKSLHNSKKLMTILKILTVVIVLIIAILLTGYMFSRHPYYSSTTWLVLGGALIAIVAFLFAVAAEKAGMIVTGAIYGFELATVSFGPVTFQRFKYLDPNWRLGQASLGKSMPSTCFHIPECMPKEEASRRYIRILIVGSFAAYFAAATLIVLGLLWQLPSILYNWEFLAIGVALLGREWIRHHPRDGFELVGDPAVLAQLRKHPIVLLEGLALALDIEETHAALRSPIRLAQTSTHLAVYIRSDTFQTTRQKWSSVLPDLLVLDCFLYWYFIDRSEFDNARHFGDALAINVESALEKGEQVGTSYAATSFVHRAFSGKPGDQLQLVDGIRFQLETFGESNWKVLCDSAIAFGEMRFEDARVMLHAVASEPGKQTKSNAFGLAIQQFAVDRLIEIDRRLSTPQETAL